MKAAGIPGLSLAYVKAGKIQEAYYLGVRSTDTKEAVDSATVFSAASLSKCVFAYAVMKLVDAGKLSLDSPLYKYLDYPDLRHDERYKKITVRMTLSHTSGLPNWRNGQKLNFRYNPGEQYSYSGEGFVLLSKVVEKISGKPIGEWMQENALTPLKMDRSSYIWESYFNNDYAWPHTDLGKTTFHNNSTKANMAYSLETTAGDYARFLMALLNGKDLKKETFQAIFKPQPHSQFEKFPSQLAWGLGVGYENTGAEKAFWQWGDNGNFKGFMIGYPGTKEGLVYFADSYNGLSILQDLVALYFPGEHPLIQWLGYDDYKSAGFQLIQRITSLPFREAVQPYLQPGKDQIDTNQLKEDALVSTGFRLIELKKYDLALQTLDMSRKAYPNSAGAYEGLGFVALRTGNQAEAARQFLHAYELDTSRKLIKRTADHIKGVADTSVGKPTEFILANVMEAMNVQLTGSFNGWNDATIPMTWINGAWRTTIRLRPGEYRYKFIVDGIWISDPKNPNVKIDDNLNSVIVIKD